jgi:signal transduction histidine kinase
VTRVTSVIKRHWLDLLIVLAAIEVALEVVLRTDAHNAPTTSLWFTAPAAAVLVLTLLGRHRWPFAAPASLWILAASFSFVDGRLVTFPFAVQLAGLGAAFLLGNVRDDREARIGLAIVIGSSLILILNDPSHSATEPVLLTSLFALTWFAGYALRERGVRAEMAEERALHAERERETAARIAVAEERIRIARELHDVVAHAVSVMVLQVGAVRHRLPASDSRDAEALQGVEQTGREALTEMRRLLGALRHTDEEPERAPQPGLGTLDVLIEEVRQAGLPVQLHVDGEPVPLPGAIDLSAYRIVQEGLTNALKHAHARNADVVLRYGSEELEIEVRDDGDGTGVGTGVSSGYGLAGIRERIRIYGGEMTAGSENGAGFVLSATLPLGGDQP